MDSVWILTETDFDSTEILCVFDGKYLFDDIRTHIHKSFSKLDESLWIHNSCDLFYIRFDNRLFEINKLKLIEVNNG